MGSSLNGGSTTRPRLLMIAYACSPVRGSEHGVGWGRATQAGKTMDTWVICGEESRPDIDHHLVTHGPVPGVEFVFVGPSRVEQAIERFAHGPFRHNYLAYGLWHRRAYRVAAKLHQALHFDLTHQANTCGYREPGYLWKLDAPFVWGPVGGTQNYPWRFLGHAGARGAILEAARTVANVIQLHTSSRVRKAVKRASVVLAANSTGRRDIERAHKTPVRLLLETGLYTVVATPRTFSNAKPLRILWSGELKPNKGLSLLLAALGQLESPTTQVNLRVLGKGPAEAALRAVARRKGVGNACEWLGWLPFTDVAAQYDWADVLIFTSLRDTSGNVMLEAMSRGVPVICLDHQGAADIVTDACGFKVAVDSPTRAIRDLRTIVGQLVSNRDLLAARSAPAIERARSYLWDANGDQMAAVYESVLASRTKPERRVG